MSQPSASSVHQGGSKTGASSKTRCGQCGKEYGGGYVSCPHCTTMTKGAGDVGKAVVPGAPVDTSHLDRAQVAVALIEALNLTPAFAARFDNRFEETGSNHTTRAATFRDDAESIRKALTPLLDVALAEDDGSDLAVTRSALTDALLPRLLTVTPVTPLAKHGSHDQKTHGNWAHAHAIHGHSVADEAHETLAATGEIAWEVTNLDEIVGEQTAHLVVQNVLASNPRRPGEDEFKFMSRVLNQFDPATRSAVMAGVRERYEPVQAAADAARAYRAAKGLPEPKIDWDEVVRDDAKAVRVAHAYLSTPDQSKDPRVIAAYDDFKRQNEEMYSLLTRPKSQGGLGIKVSFVDAQEPYPSAEAQAQDFARGHLKISHGLGKGHPLMDGDTRGGEYDRFRAVHDAFGHVAIGGGFDRHGEYAAWVAHNSMYTGEGRLAMSTEYHGTNSVLTTGGAADTRAILLPDDLVANTFDAEGNVVRKEVGSVSPVAYLDLNLATLTQPCADRAAIVRAIAKARRANLIVLADAGSPGAAALLDDDRADRLCASCNVVYKASTFLVHCDEDIPTEIAKALGFAGRPYPGEFRPPSNTVFRPDPRLHSHPFKPDPQKPNTCKDCGKGTGIHSRMVMKPEPNADDEKAKQQAAEEKERQKAEEQARKEEETAAKIEHDMQAALADRAKIDAKIRLIARQAEQMGMEIADTPAGEVVEEIVDDDAAPVDPDAREKKAVKKSLWRKVAGALGLETDPVNHAELDPDLSYAVVKSSAESRFTLGPMYIPFRRDAHREWATPEDLQAATWEYVKATGADRRIYLQHSPKPAGEWVEIMAWPYEVEATMTRPGALQKSRTTFPAGTVYMGVIWEPWAYEEVKKGRLTGFSMGGRARRRVEYIPAEMDEPAPDDGVPVAKMRPAEFSTAAKPGDPDAIAKHGSNHDEKTHGNWASGKGFSHSPRVHAGDKASDGKGRGAHVHLKDGSILVTNVDDAIALLAAGKKITLRQPREVSTLVRKLHEVVRDMEARGEKAPLYNLCNVSVPGTNLFCADNKGVRRIDMPQLKGVPVKGSKADSLKRDERGEVDLNAQFREYLAHKGVKISDETEKASYLRATQKELVGAKVAGIAQAFRDGKLADERLFISHDGYVVDGHHRWAAQVGVDLDDNKAGDVDMKVARIDMDILGILAEANAFAEAWGIPQAHAKSRDGQPVCLGCD